MTKIVKIKAFLIIFGPNKRAHRVQRSILHKKRPGGRSGRRFDFVETSPEGLGIFLFFHRKNGYFWIPPGTERVNQTACEKLFFPKML